MERVSGPVRVKERDALKEIFKNMFPEDNVPFEVIIDSPFYSCPNSITLRDLSKAKKGGPTSRSPVDLGSSNEHSLRPEFSIERGSKLGSSIGRDGLRTRGSRGSDSVSSFAV